jgi:hypothetical protein
VTTVTLQPAPLFFSPPPSPPSWAPTPPPPHTHTHPDTPPRSNPVPGTVAVEDLYDALKLPKTHFSNALLCSVLGHDHDVSRRRLPLPEFVALM